MKTSSRQVEALVSSPKKSTPPIQTVLSSSSTTAQVSQPTQSFYSSLIGRSSTGGGAAAAAAAASSQSSSSSSSQAPAMTSSHFQSQYVVSTYSTNPNNIQPHTTNNNGSPAPKSGSNPSSALSMARQNPPATGITTAQTYTATSSSPAPSSSHQKSKMGTDSFSSSTRNSQGTLRFLRTSNIASTNQQGGNGAQPRQLSTDSQLKQTAISQLQQPPPQQQQQFHSSIQQGTKSSQIQTKHEAYSNSVSPQPTQQLGQAASTTTYMSSQKSGGGTKQPILQPQTIPSSSALLQSQQQIQQHLIQLGARVNIQSAKNSNNIDNEKEQNNSMPSPRGITTTPIGIDRNKFIADHLHCATSTTMNNRPLSVKSVDKKQVFEGPQMSTSLRKRNPSETNLIKQDGNFKFTGAETTVIAQSKIVQLSQQQSQLQQQQQRRNQSNERARGQSGSLDLKHLEKHSTELVAQVQKAIRSHKSGTRQGGTYTKTETTSKSSNAKNSKKQQQQQQQQQLMNGTAMAATSSSLVGRVITQPRQNTAAAHNHNTYHNIHGSHNLNHHHHHHHNNNNNNNNNNPHHHLHHHQKNQIPNPMLDSEAVPPHSTSSSSQPITTLRSKMTESTALPRNQVQSYVAQHSQKLDSSIEAHQSSQGRVGAVQTRLDDDLRSQLIARQQADSMTPTLSSVIANLTEWTNSITDKKIVKTPKSGGGGGGVGLTSSTSKDARFLYSNSHSAKQNEVPQGGYPHHTIQSLHTESVCSSEMKDHTYNQLSSSSKPQTACALTSVGDNSNTTSNPGFRPAISRNSFSETLPQSIKASEFHQLLSALNQHQESLQHMAAPTSKDGYSPTVSPMPSFTDLKTGSSKQRKHDNNVVGGIISTPQSNKSTRQLVNLPSSNNSSASGKKNDTFRHQIYFMHETGKNKQTNCQNNGQASSALVGTSAAAAAATSTVVGTTNGKRAGELVVSSASTTKRAVNSASEKSTPHSSQSINNRSAQINSHSSSVNPSVTSLQKSWANHMKQVAPIESNANVKGQLSYSQNDISLGNLQEIKEVITSVSSQFNFDEQPRQQQQLQQQQQQQQQQPIQQLQQLQQYIGFVEKSETGGVLASGEKPSYFQSVFNNLFIKREDEFRQDSCSADGIQLQIDSEIIRKQQQQQQRNGSSSTSSTPLSYSSKQQQHHHQYQQQPLQFDNSSVDVQIREFKTSLSSLQSSLSSSPQSHQRFRQNQQTEQSTVGNSSVRGTPVVYSASSAKRASTGGMVGEIEEQQQQYVNRQMYPQTASDPVLPLTFKIDDEYASNKNRVSQGQHHVNLLDELCNLRSRVSNQLSQIQIARQTCSSQVLRIETLESMNRDLIAASTERESITTSIISEKDLQISQLLEKIKQLTSHQHFESAKDTTPATSSSPLGTSNNDLGTAGGLDESADFTGNKLEMSIEELKLRYQIPLASLKRNKFNLKKIPVKQKGSNINQNQDLQEELVDAQQQLAEKSSPEKMNDSFELLQRISLRQQSSKQPQQLQMHPGTDEGDKGDHLPEFNMAVDNNSANSPIYQRGFVANKQVNESFQLVQQQPFFQVIDTNETVHSFVPTCFTTGYSETHSFLNDNKQQCTSYTEEAKKRSSPFASTDITQKANGVNSSFSTPACFAGGLVDDSFGGAQGENDGMCEAGPAGTTNNAIAGSLDDDSFGIASSAVVGQGEEKIQFLQNSFGVINSEDIGDDEGDSINDVSNEKHGVRINDGNADDYGGGSNVDQKMNGQDVKEMLQISFEMSSNSRENNPHSPNAIYQEFPDESIQHQLKQQEEEQQSSVINFINQSFG